MSLDIVNLSRSLWADAPDALTTPSLCFFSLKYSLAVSPCQNIGAAHYGSIFGEIDSVILMPAACHISYNDKKQISSPSCPLLFIAKMSDLTAFHPFPLAPAQRPATSTPARVQGSTSWGSRSILVVSTILSSSIQLPIPFALKMPVDIRDPVANEFSPVYGWDNHQYNEHIHQHLASLKVDRRYDIWLC